MRVHYLISVIRKSSNDSTMYPIQVNQHNSGIVYLVTLQEILKERGRERKCNLNPFLVAAEMLSLVFINATPRPIFVSVCGAARQASVYA